MRPNKFKVPNTWEDHAFMISTQPTFSLLFSTYILKAFNIENLAPIEEGTAHLAFQEFCPGFPENTAFAPSRVPEKKICFIGLLQGRTSFKPWRVSISGQKSTLTILIPWFSALPSLYRSLILLCVVANWSARFSVAVNPLRLARHCQILLIYQPAEDQSLCVYNAMDTYAFMVFGNSSIIAPSCTKSRCLDFEISKEV